MVTIRGHNALDRDFANIQALGRAQCGISGRYFLMVLPLLIKMEFEVHDQLFQALIGFQGRGRDEVVQSDFYHDLFLQALPFQ